MAEIPEGKEGQQDAAAGEQDTGAFTLNLPAGQVSFTEAEGQLFSQLFRVVDTDEDDLVGGGEGSAFLSRSKLPKEMLREVWRLACGGQSKATLSRECWFVACKLVALAQAEGQCSMAPLFDGQILPLPDFHINDAVDENVRSRGGCTACAWCAVRRVLCAVCCVLCVLCVLCAVCRVLHALCCMLCAVCCVRCAVCCEPYRCVPRAVCHMPRAVQCFAACL